jgi:hypothetical protein
MQNLKISPYSYQNISTLNMKAAFSSKTLVSIYKKTRCHNSEDHILGTNYCENPQTNNVHCPCAINLLINVILINRLAAMILIYIDCHGQ